MSRVKYQLLSKAQPAIRVLMQESSTESSSLIVANPSKVNMDRQAGNAECPSYGASPAAWGDRIVSQMTVALSGYYHGVKSHLDAASRQLRHSKLK